MTQFIQLHLLTSYPPSNLNRDDLGRPKTAVVGGTNRLRISSQSLKRAWRVSNVFRDAVGGNVGIRTRRIGVEAHSGLLKGGVKETDAKKWATQIAAVFAKPKKDSAESEQIAHLSTEEHDAVHALVATLIKRGAGPEEGDLHLLRAKNKAADMAMFGRMLADSPEFNVEAATQVAHAITTHAVAVEDDYFTAVDDLNTPDDTGAGHAGVAEFGSGVFYVYACINRDILEEHLGAYGDLVVRTLRGFTEASVTVSPTGKQNSFGSRAYASFALAEKGTRQPRSLSVAFLKAAQGPDMLEAAISALQDQTRRMDKTYGPCADARYTMNTLNGDGDLKGLLDFVAE